MKFINMNKFLIFCRCLVHLFHFLLFLLWPPFLRQRSRPLGPSPRPVPSAGCLGRAGSSAATPERTIRRTTRGNRNTIFFLPPPILLLLLLLLLQLFFSSSKSSPSIPLFLCVYVPSRILLYLEDSLETLPHGIRFVASEAAAEIAGTAWDSFEDSWCAVGRGGEGRGRVSSPRISWDSLRFSRNFC